MLYRDMDSHIYFRHAPEEVVELGRAIIPMAEFVTAVCKSDERYKLRLMLTGGYFRVNEARKVRDMLLRACKYSRANLGDYFPMMQSGILEHALTLENAVNKYWKAFQRLREETMPIH